MNIQPNIPQKPDPIGMLEHETYDRVFELCKAAGLEQTRQIVAEALWAFMQRSRDNG